MRWKWTFGETGQKVQEQSFKSDQESFCRKFRRCRIHRNEDDYLEEIVEESMEIGKERGVENSTILEGDFALVELKGKKFVCHYIVEIKNILEERCVEIIDCFKIMDGNQFVKNSELYEISESEILRKLPKPLVVGGSELRMEQLSFPVDFISYNMY
ncbi:hypothetical protein JTB14_022865 [Gonioctena quinquepunctata]|nr:hypothetical protein JTB14_022865 [Gonioctena quinquepunctata]